MDGVEWSGRLTEHSGGNQYHGFRAIPNAFFNSARSIIEDMGGAIDVDTRESQGTRFTITLKVGPTSPRLSQPRVMDHTTLMEE